jgi:hypothetical protein
MLEDIYSYFHLWNCTSCCLGIGKVLKRLMPPLMMKLNVLYVQQIFRLQL